MGYIVTTIPLLDDGSKVTTELHLFSQWSFNPKRLIFVVLYNDLIDYVIVCFEHQCSTMRVL